MSTINPSEPSLNIFKCQMCSQLIIKPNQEASPCTITKRGALVYQNNLVKVRPGSHTYYFQKNGKVAWKILIDTSAFGKHQCKPITSRTFTRQHERPLEDVASSLFAETRNLMGQVPETSLHDYMASFLSKAQNLMDSIQETKQRHATK
jgi:hypothetical protein